jgi:glyoxylase-like metal-dependent hydrolase (beta-lactamase superfamily II)
MIINTHSHPDHMGSNTEIDTPAHNVEVVAQARTAARMAKLPNGGTVDRTFDDKLTLGKGADQIDLYYFGAGHTDGDTFVVFPKEKTMAAGDIYAWHMSPLIDPGSGGSMLAAAVTLTDAYYGIKGVDRVITGHHKVYSWEDFRSYMQFNRAVVDVAKQTVAHKGTPEDALAILAANPSFAPFMSEVVTPEINYGGSPKSRTLIALNVAFQEIRGEPVTTQWGPRPPAPPAGGAPGGGGAKPDGEDHDHHY